MTREDFIIYGTLLTVSIILGFIIRWGVRAHKSDDAASLALTADEVRQHGAAYLHGSDFLWAIWQDRLSASRFLLHVRDEQGDELAAITFRHYPLDGIAREFEFDGRYYQCVRNPASSTTQLRDKASRTVLLTCRHGMSKNVYFSGVDGRELFSLAIGNVFRSVSRIRIGKEAIGNLLNLPKVDYLAPLLSVLPDRLSVLEKLFLLATFSR